MRHIKPALLFLTALSVVGLASCSIGRRDQGGAIRLSGNLELTQVNIAFKMSGRLVELLIEEGDKVASGQVIARLDAEQLQQQRNRDHAALLAAEGVLPQLGTAIQQREAAVAAELDLRRAEIGQAEAVLQELLSGSRPQQIEEAKAAVEQAKSQVVQAQQDWERAQVLFKNDDISASQRDQQRARLDAAAAAMRQAEERAALVVEGPRKEQIDSARARVAQARAALKMTEAAQLEIRRLEQELEIRRADVARARAQVALVDAQLKDTVVSSPIDGIVLVKSAEAGEVLAAGTSVASIGNLAQPWLRGYITETDLGRVKLGAKVRVTTDSYPGKAYWGRVSFIASEAEFTPKQIQTPEERIKLVYRIKINVDNPDQELKLNMPADAEIMPAEKQQAASL
jgi:HlyD family secretion protein